MPPPLAAAVLSAPPFPLLLLLYLSFPLLMLLLQYHLPASYDVLPLMARMTGGLVQQQQGGAVVLLSLQWHVPRELKQQAKGEEGCAVYCVFVCV